MGVQLDWQLETERMHQKANESPDQRRQRREQRRQLLLFTLGIMFSICIVVGAVWYRLYTVEEQLKRELIETVQAETTTLRVGDYAQFIAIQRTAKGGEDWLTTQGNTFKKYQELKATRNVNLNGRIIDVTLRDQTGRVIVEELIDGVPYQVMWFYWRYQDGWRHVYPDLTFWGEDKTIQTATVTIQYKTLDEPLAQLLLPKIEAWWGESCAALGCPFNSPLKLMILPTYNRVPFWDGATEPTLIIPSPRSANERIRSDETLPSYLEDAIGTSLALSAFNLAVQNRPIEPTSDAAWLRQTIIDWLVASFNGRAEAEKLTFIQSIYDHYGADGVQRVTQALTHNGEISLVGAALNQPIERLAVDWRTFFQWRLDVEKTLLTNGNYEKFQLLWDAANPQALELMRRRQANPSQATAQVQSVAIAPGVDGVPRASVQVISGGRTELIIFRLVEGSWKRSA